MDSNAGWSPFVFGLGNSYYELRTSGPEETEESILEDIMDNWAESEAALEIETVEKTQATFCQAVFQVEQEVMVEPLRASFETVNRRRLPLPEILPVERTYIPPVRNTPNTKKQPSIAKPVQEQPAPLMPVPPQGSRLPLPEIIIPSISLSDLPFYDLSKNQEQGNPRQNDFRPIRLTPQVLSSMPIGSTKSRAIDLTSSEIVERTDAVFCQTEISIEKEISLVELSPSPNRPIISSLPKILPPFEPLKPPTRKATPKFIHLPAPSVHTGKEAISAEPSLAHLRTLKSSLPKILPLPQPLADLSQKLPNKRQKQLPQEPQAQSSIEFIHPVSGPSLKEPVLHSSKDNIPSVKQNARGAKRKWTAVEASSSKASKNPSPLALSAKGNSFMSLGESVIPGQQSDAAARRNIDLRKAQINLPTMAKD